MRIAWLGPLGEDGGVPAMGRALMLGLLRRGVEIDFFSDLSGEKVATLLGDSPLLRVKQIPSWWKWNQWYSRNTFLAFLSNSVARTQNYNAICKAVIQSHRERNYDCIFQFSQLELFGLNKHFKQLPPVVVYPCVHTAGELRWHRKESSYALQAESRISHCITRCILMWRTGVQRRESRKPALMIGMSKRFNQLIARDYGLHAKKMAVLYHPIDIQNLSVGKANAKIKVVFAGRISVRKGIEMIVDLSRKLDDLKDEIEMEVIGGYTQWSDYRKNLEALNPDVARYAGEMSNTELMDSFSSSDVLIVPSHYEPGGIVVGEAVSRGMCVVASDEVGSAEPLEGAFIRKFKAGDSDAFEKCTREMIAQARQQRESLRIAAHEAAKAQFDPDKIGGQLLDIIERACKSQGRKSGS